MKTIKIARISGEFMNENGEICSYLQPYTGFDSLSWLPYKKAKKIFDSLNFESLLKQEDDTLDEFKSSKEELELNIFHNNEEGYKPKVYLFTYDIPESIWKNKKRYAQQDGYEDDVMSYITDFTDYSWEMEQEKEIKIPDNLIKMYDNFIWIEDNREKLQLKYMQFLVETGGDDETTENSFYLFIANEDREIINY